MWLDPQNLQVCIYANGIHKFRSVLLEKNAITYYFLPSRDELFEPLRKILYIERNNQTFAKKGR